MSFRVTRFGHYLKINNKHTSSLYNINKIQFFDIGNSFFDDDKDIYLRIHLNNNKYHSILLNDTINNYDEVLYMISDELSEWNPYSLPNDIFNKKL